MIEIYEISIKEFEKNIYDRYVELFPKDEQRKWFKIKKSYKEGIEKFYKIDLDKNNIGFIMIEKLENHPYYLEYIGIYPEYQDKGYGTRVMNKLLKEVVKKDGIIVEIEQISDDNIQAKRRFNFYDRLNFKKADSKYLLCGVKYDPIYYGYEGSQEELDKIFFDYYIRNNSVKKVKKDFIILEPEIRKSSKNDELKYEKVTKKNINVAVKIQNRIFPLEDGLDDLNESIDQSKKYFDTLEYYLIHNGEYYVGITGIYSHKEYPDDAWVGWFGILPMFRKRHYALRAMEFTKNKAKSLGFKTLRLYTDDKYNFASISLFEKLGMTRELYEAEEGKYYKVGNMLIYSISLDGKKVEPWNNKCLFLEEHEIKNNKLELKYVEINKKNLNIAANIQYNLFYDCNNVGYLDYLKEVENSKDRLKNKLLPIDFLVYHEDTPVGIIGLYDKKEYPDDVWITWFGVVPQYRNHGIGTQMLLKIIEVAKMYGKKNLRLNTYETWNYKAQNIYKRTMQLSENYINEDEEHFLIRYGKPKIYSISLDDVDVIPWNNKFLNLTEELELNEESIKKLKEDNILEIFSESSFMEYLIVKK